MATLVEEKDVVRMSPAIAHNGIYNRAGTVGVVGVVMQEKVYGRAESTSEADHFVSVSEVSLADSDGAAAAGIVVRVGTPTARFARSTARRVAAGRFALDHCRQA